MPYQGGDIFIRKVSQNQGKQKNAQAKNVYRDSKEFELNGGQNIKVHQFHSFAEFGVCRKRYKNGHSGTGHDHFCISPVPEKISVEVKRFCPIPENISFL